MTKSLKTKQAKKSSIKSRCQYIAERSTPEGWIVNHHYTHGAAARCYFELKQLDVPEPVNRKKLFSYLHECGHATLHTDRAYFPGTDRISSMDYEAEQFAARVMDKGGIEVSHHQMRETMNRLWDAAFDDKRLWGLEAHPKVETFFGLPVEAALEYLLRENL